MYKLKIVSLMIACFLIMSCDSNECCVNVDIGIKIIPENQNSQSLLDTTIIGHINPDLIRVSYLIDGKIVPAYSSNLDCASQICLETDNNKKWLNLIPNSTESEVLPITYIHWNTTNTDTLKCQFLRKDGLLKCEKIWYNEELVYPTELNAQTDRIIRPQI